MYKTNANNMFVSGEIDYIKVPYHTVSADMIDYYKANDQLQIGEMAAFYNYIMNMNAPQLANLNIRKALALAVVNRQELIQNITKANQTPATRIIGPTAVGASQD